MSSEKQFAEQHEYIEKLDQIVQNALTNYTRDDYSQINNYLRNGGDVCPRILKEIELIDSAFALVPPITSSITVYRGQDDKFFDTKSYTSTSIKPDIGEDYLSIENKCCLFEITVAAGSRVIPIESVSEYGYEFEVLLDRNGEFHITQNSVENVKLDSSAEKVLMRVIKLVYMPSGSLEIESDDDIEKFEEKDSVRSIEKILSYILTNMKTNIEDDEISFEEKIDKSDREVLKEYSKISYQNVKNISKEKLPEFDEDIADIIIDAYIQSN